MNALSANSDADFAAATHALLHTHGALLLSLAKRSIIHTLDQGRPLEVDLSTLPSPLRETGACFVTLKKSGRLRGCIGSPEAWRPLGTDVVANADRAAFHDPRFGPVSLEETAALDIHISVLSPKHPFPVTSNADMVAQLNPSVDGLIISDQGLGALFLPSVWDQLPDPELFVARLKHKAGLSPEHWSDTFQAWRFIAADTGADWDAIVTD